MAKKSAFDELGFTDTLDHLKDEVRRIYLADEIPWVVGYSGGKDSTATLQLVWTALSELPPEQLTKPVHVISTDTLVENPVVAAWVSKCAVSCRYLCLQKAGMPITLRIFLA